MNRSKITNNLIKYLNKKVNCDNILVEIIKNGKNKKNGECVIDLIQSLYVIIDYSSNSMDTIISTESANKLVEKYDFMSESNHTGFEYFPYLYGVLDCSGTKHNIMYVFYEYFEKSIGSLFTDIEHPSEWYDICFQLINIDNYITNIKSKKYSCTLKNILYNVNNSKIIKTYQINNKTYKINHKYLIVLWNFEFSENSNNCVECFYRYITQNNDIINKPSPRIISLLEDYNRSHNLSAIMEKYY